MREIPREIPELYAFTDETKYNMGQEFIDEVARQVKYGKEELYAAIQLFSVAGCEHSWAFRFQQVERLDPNLVKFEIAHYYTYGSNYADMRYYINKPKNADYYYFDFMLWFYFLKGIVFDYNNKLFMKITEEYKQKKYYFGEKVTVDEYYDELMKQLNAASLKKCGKNLDDITTKYYNEFRKEAKQREELGEFHGIVRNPFIREWGEPITQDIIVADTSVLNDCSAIFSYETEEEKNFVKVYNGHKYERPKP